MFIKNFILRAAGAGLAAICLLAVQPLGAQTASESERLQKLERAVEQLQKRNAQLEQEVSSLKKRGPVASDGKTYVEKNVVQEEKPPIYVVPRGPEIKLTLGGFIQANFEDGDVSAFEGRFGLTALKDRIRLRRARINMTGEFAENFDFKIEGDFEQGDGISPSRTAFSGTEKFSPVASGFFSCARREPRRFHFRKRSSPPRASFARARASPTGQPTCSSPWSLSDCSAMPRRRSAFCVLFRGPSCPWPCTELSNSTSDFRNSNSIT